ncbi:hypothetical protein [uncultured Aquimarina sp.]|uniref:hypothetical protein n=1 Tax=uncultured Aquimarina sp. TaxID=575652 RepID=UPI002602640C|nr:hypothetical protein [uncultured Aquimarina sp.]
MEGNREEIMKLLEEMAIANSSKQDILKIKNLLLKYNKGFRLAKEKEFNKAQSVFLNADIVLHYQFKEGSFEYYFIQLFAISSKSYLEFKMNNKEQAIVLTKKGIEYSILLQEYQSSHNIMGVFISQMLENLAKIHLLSKETKDWYDITLENIHFLLNFSRPRNCQDFDISRFKKTPLQLRYSKLISVLNDVLINITKFKVTNGQKLIESIIINDKSDPIITLIDSWVELNVCINKQHTQTDVFNTTYNNFLESEHNNYDLQNLKLFLEYRIKEEGIQLYEVV